MIAKGEEKHRKEKECKEKVCNNLCHSRGDGERDWKERIGLETIFNYSLSFI